jgi:diguanylate cyclase (GGDEF)-like protein
MSHSAAARMDPDGADEPQVPEAKREVMVVDDQAPVLAQLKGHLEDLGYVVRVADSGEAALAEIRRRRPDLVILDIAMPGMDGPTVCREIKGSPRTSSIPIIMLTRRNDMYSKVQSLQCGANDYLTKPYHRDELQLRVKNALDLRDQLRDTNPLTRLPGNSEIERQLRQRVSAAESFAYMFIDIDNFKAFNDLYGHSRGDRLILGTAEILSRVIEELGGETDFLGHVGGDDFVILCDASRANVIGEAIALRFDGMIGEHLDPRERERGFLEVPGRTGTVEQHRITSITVAVVSTPDQAFSHAGDVSARAAEVKRHAKAQARRGERKEGSFVVWERRGSGAA